MVRSQPQPTTGGQQILCTENLSVRDSVPSILTARALTGTSKGPLPVYTVMLQNSAFSRDWYLTCLQTDPEVSVVTRIVSHHTKDLLFLQ